MASQTAGSDPLGGGGGGGQQVTVMGVTEFSQELFKVQLYPCNLPSHKI
jgi:hypothetical protein